GQGGQYVLVGGANDGGLGGEVVQHCRLGDPRTLGDPGEGGSAVAVLGDPVDGDLDELGTPRLLGQGGFAPVPGLLPSCHEAQSTVRSNNQPIGQQVSWVKNVPHANIDDESSHWSAASGCWRSSPW